MKLETPNEPTQSVCDTAEAKRLANIDEGDGGVAWRTWGPYLSGRQWGTVREDYSADGDAWSDFPFEHARSRAYRWGEDGIGGFCDDEARLCLAIALWNGLDPILKERFFGLDNAQGNHGEDVKELYWFLDGTPTHAYMRMLYRYPQAAFPYELLIEKNATRGLDDPEYEIVETGVFDDRRYFDVEIEYAKAGVDDLVMRVTATNRGDAPAPLHLLPQLWARNTWSWREGAPRALLEADHAHEVRAQVPALAPMRLVCEREATLLFCENETNTPLLYAYDRPGPFKDGIDAAIVRGDRSGLSATQRGTKLAAHRAFDVAPGASVAVVVRLVRDDGRHRGPGYDDDLARFVGTVIDARRCEADAFYAALQHDMADADARLVQRQAFAGLLWCKQYYGFDVRRWFSGDPTMPKPPDVRPAIRNGGWRHMVLSDVISMPDDWEYPWFASWDLAFHCIAFAPIDAAFAKSQLVLLLQARSQHPNGELPAYEWNLDAVNPPVHAFAALEIFAIDERQTGVADLAFLERIFHKLLLNFTWWVNREDETGRNVFQGGFLGLDNIALFDRSVPMRDGSTVDQADATAWMAMYALNMLRMAMRLAVRDPVYEDLATKFFEHFIYIAEAAHGNDDVSSTGLWDQEDGFYYDVLRKAGGAPRPLRVRSLVGLIPLLAVEVFSDRGVRALPQFVERLRWFIEHRPRLAKLVSRWQEMSTTDERLVALMRRERMNRVLSRMLDESEFLSPYGIRSLSKAYEREPYRFEQEGTSHAIAYEPAEGRTRLFGGNSNWRGPVWMPINYLLIDALRKYFAYYGPEHRVPFPSKSGPPMDLDAIADALTARLCALFLKDGSGRRPCLGDDPIEHDDKVLFHEYFHGDTGRGLGASHQTGWTALVAVLLMPRPRPS